MFGLRFTSPRPLAFSIVVLFALTPAFAAGPKVVKESRHDTSAPLSQLSVGSAAKTTGPDREAEKPRATGAPRTSGKADPVAGGLAGSLTGVTQVIGFDGQSADDNRAVFGFAFVPPDTNGAVGNKQYVQMVNVTIAVYNKSDGSLQLGPAPIHSLWKGFGGLCEFGGESDFYSDGGDPVVLYDRIANRWLVSQLQYDETFTHSAQCIAVSTGSDATGSYNRYEYDFGTSFPDYPKFGVWPDGYYNSINVYPGGFAGAAACAFDRNAMLAGTQANAICFQQPPSVSSLLPSDLDGSTLPPTGAPNYFIGLADSSHLNLFAFHADFKNPTNSTFTGPKLIPVAAFNEICARANAVACIPEPEPGEKVDGLADRVMFRLAYRNFGDHESLVVNHTVSGGALAGVRWYEIRNPGATLPAVYQQGTLVDPNTNYWLGSIAMDKAGDIALGFSAMSHNLFSSVYVAGRTPADAPGQMRGPLVLANGSGVQFNSYKRWGDYSSMTVDPKDDCTFWFTQEYYLTTGSFNWATRIGAFKFDNCKPSTK